jgi:hypothetical protein
VVERRLAEIVPELRSLGEGYFGGKLNDRIDIGTSALHAMLV